MSTVGVALPTTSVVVTVRAAQCPVSAGVNVTDSVCVPAPRTVPAGGEYANVPGKLEVAFNCAASSAVPYAIGAACGHVTGGVPPRSVTLACASAAPKASSPAKAAAIAFG